MSWTTPKTNWAVDPVAAGDFNRIEGNIAVLHAGNGQNSLQTAVGAVNLSLPNATDETFKVEMTGTEQITYIETTNRQAGNRIQLIVASSTLSPYATAGAIVHNGSSPPTNYAKIHVHSYGGSWGTTTIYVCQLITLVYDGVAWHCTT